LVALGLMFAAASASAPAGAEDWKWFRSKDDGVYVQYPANWAVFKGDQDLRPVATESARTAGRPEGKVVKPGGFGLVIDGSAKAIKSRTTSRARVDEDIPSEPVIAVSVMRFGEYDFNDPLRDALSFRLLRLVSSVTKPDAFRRLILDPEDVEFFDAYEKVVEERDPRFEIRHYERLIEKDGRWGSRMSFNVDLAPEGSATRNWKSVSEMTYVSKDFNTIYRIWAHCSAVCFLKNEKTLDRVISSFTIRPPSDRSA
jgi:hypothetical protein